MKRKIWSILLAAAMLLTLLPTSVLAEDVSSADAFQTALEKGGEIRAAGTGLRRCAAEIFCVVLDCIDLRC